MQCVHLRERFGGRYRIGFDPAYDPRHVPKRKLDPWIKLDPWMMTVECHRGTVYPFGGEMLAVEVEGRLVTAGRLAQVEGVEVYQDGDREKTLLFHVDRFPEVAEIVKPRRRRQVSGAERSRLLQIGLSV